MRTYILQREQWVDRPLDRVFPFFERPENLALITPPGLDFRLLTPRPVKMEQGRVIDYTIRIFAMPVRWRTLITTYEPPFRFVDEQILGPYSFWHHTHTFTEIPGGTLIGDDVRYLLPLGWLGDLMNALAVRRRLEGIFTHRRRVVAERFGELEPEI